LKPPKNFLPRSVYNKPPLHPVPRETCPLSYARERRLFPKSVMSKGEETTPSQDPQDSLVGWG